MFEYRNLHLYWSKISLFTSLTNLFCNGQPKKARVLLKSSQLQLFFAKLLGRILQISQQLRWSLFFRKFTDLHLTTFIKKETVPLLPVNFANFFIIVSLWKTCQRLPFFYYRFNCYICIEELPETRSTYYQVFYEEVSLKSFAKFIEKHMCQKVSVLKTLQAYSLFLY